MTFLYTPNFGSALNTSLLFTESTIESLELTFESFDGYKEELQQGGRRQQPWRV
jgi:hypothetical protein